MKSNRKILFISRAYGQNAGGMERLSFELLSQFPNAQKIVNETKSGRSLLSTRLHSIVFAVFVLPKALLAARRADYVHIGDPVLSIVGWCIAKLYAIPVAVTVHGLDVSYSNAFYRMYLRLFFRNFSTYIAISEYAKKLLLSHKVSGTIVVIPPGITDSLFDHSKTRYQLGTLLHRNVEKRTVLLTAGRLIARKGHAWFIRHVLPKLPRNVLYVIAGGGPEKDALTSLIKTLKVEDRVIMLGRVSEEDLKTLLNTADAFIQPNVPVSHDGEGFGIAPLEAALCGRVVFASRIDGIPSSIHDGKNGVLLPPTETTAWVNALTHYSEKPLGAVPHSAARTYTKETFSWDRIRQQYETVLGL